MLLPSTKSNKVKGSKPSNRTVDRLIISNRAVRLYSRNLLYKILDPSLLSVKYLNQVMLCVIIIMHAKQVLVEIHYNYTWFNNTANNLVLKLDS